MAWSNRRFYDGDCKESFVTLKTFYLAIPCYSEIPPIWGHVLIPRGPSYLGPPHTVRSLFSVPKRQNPVFQGSLQMPECFWNASSFARPRNGRIMVQQIKCQNPVGWFKMQKKLDSYPATGFYQPQAVKLCSCHFYFVSFFKK